MIGQSFSPTENYDPMRPQGSPQNDHGAALQQAIQVLQLRMPHFFGGSAPAPAPLLQSQGAPAGFNLQALLQRMLGMQGPQAGLPGGTAGPGPMQPLPNEPRMELPQGGGGMQGAAPLPIPTPAFHYQPNPGGTAGPPMHQPLQNRPGPLMGRGRL